MLSRLKTALRALLRRAQAERELDEELRYHIEGQTEQNIRLGMAPEEARTAARKAFGGVEQAKERSRDARGVRLLEELWQDLRYGASILTAAVALSFVDYPNGDTPRRAAYFRQALERLQRLPGVESVGAISQLMFGGRTWQVSFRILGRAEDRQGTLADHRVVTPSFF